MLNIYIPPSCIVIFHNLFVVFPILVHLSANCNTKSFDPRNFNANVENRMLLKWIHMEMHVHNSLEYAYERMECVRDHLMMLNISSTALFPVRSIWAAQQPAFYLQSFHFYFLIAFYCLFSPRFSCRFIQTTFFVCVLFLRNCSEIAWKTFL